MTSPAFPDTATTLTLPGPAGGLEVAVDPPEADVPAQPVVAVVCHPLPTEGGTMHNKVVTMTARALRELGVPSYAVTESGPDHDNPGSRSDHDDAGS